MTHDIAIYVLIFALGMLVGYLLKVVMVNKERIKKNRYVTDCPSRCDLNIR